MGKWLKYDYRKVLEEKNPLTGEMTQREVMVSVKVPDTPQGRLVAEKEAYGDILELEDEQKIQPSRMDIVEAQVAYTAMMTDTLLEV